MNDELTFQEKYDAIIRKDSSFEGVFFTAVKTTKIFCRPNCTARKPKPENVIFYNTAKEALLNGFRPCKICKPLEQQDKTPDYIHRVIDELNRFPYKKIKDYELRKRGIDPAQIRRWFKKHHNITFHTYQRMLRINNAFNKIATGTKVTESAFENGYESLSGFNYGYQSVFGYSPTKAKNKNVINIIRFTTPLGPMFACSTQKGICLLEFTDRKMLETEFRTLQKLLNSAILPGNNPHLEQLLKELKEYFEGKRKSFTVTTDMPGTDLQKRVWNELKEISYGETSLYKQKAAKLNMDVRIFRKALGFSRVAIVIPCHRVTGDDGNLTGYGGGLPRKKWLLEFEKNITSKQNNIEVRSNYNLIPAPGNS